jgi:prophage DNA circulation protein
MRLLRDVFRSPGPYTLVHPWLGTMKVVLVPGQRPRISLSAKELQVARFEVAVYPFNPSAQAGLDTLAQLETQLSSLTADAENWMANAISPVASAVAAFSFAQSWLNNAATLFDNAVSLTASAGEIGPAVAGTIAGLGNAIGAPVASFPATAAASLTAVVAAFAGACTPPVPSAVAPGGTTTAAAAADPADTVTTLLAVLPGVAASATGPVPAPALAAGLQAAIVGGAVQAASNIRKPAP